MNSVIFSNLHQRSASLRCSASRGFYFKFTFSSDAGSSGLSGSSSMLNLSPDIGDMDHNSHDSSGHGGFYLLRKDSERRLPLVHILTKDMEQVPHPSISLFVSLSLSLSLSFTISLSLSFSLSLSLSLSLPLSLSLSLCSLYMSFSSSLFHSRFLFELYAQIYF